MKHALLVAAVVALLSGPAVAELNTAKFNADTLFAMEVIMEMRGRHVKEWRLTGIRAACALDLPARDQQLSDAREYQEITETFEGQFEDENQVAHVLAAYISFRTGFEDATREVWKFLFQEGYVDRDDTCGVLQ